MSKESSHHEEILKKRARELARPLEEAEEHRLDLERFVIFKRGREFYGLRATLIQGVYPLLDKRYSRIPGVADFIFGIANIRGKLYSLIDIARFLEQPSTSTPDKVYVIIVQVKSPPSDMTKEVGIIADNLPRLEAVDMSTVTEPEGIEIPVTRDCIIGLTRNMEVMVDVERFLSIPELIIEQII